MPFDTGRSSTKAGRLEVHLILSMPSSKVLPIRNILTMDLDVKSLV